MTPAVQASFDNFRAALTECNFSLPDIFDFVADTIVSGQGYQGNAILRHMIDVMGELKDGSDIACDELMAEGYRRTFCDPSAASKYGTLDLIPQDERTCCGMLDSMADLLRQRSGASAQQTLDLISADTSGPAH